MKNILLLFFLIPNLVFSKSIIHEMKGEVFFNGIQATKSSTLNNGDKIETKDGLITFLFGEEIYKLRPNTIFILPANKKNSPSTLIKGAILGAFKKGGKRKMIIQSTATLTIRGTGVYAKNVEGEQKRYCLCYGASDLETHDHSHSVDTESKYHKEFIITDSGEIREWNASEFELNHYSFENIELEKELGNDSPFVSTYRNTVGFLESRACRVIRSDFIQSSDNLSSLFKTSEKYCGYN